MATAAQQTVLGKIGDQAVTLEQVLKSPAGIDLMMNVLQEAAQRRVIATEAQSRSLKAGDDELQNAADDFRRSRGLHQAADTHKWLEKRHLSVDDLEEYVRFLVLRARLQETLVDNTQVDKHFHEHKASLDSVLVSHLVVKEEGVAREILTQIEEDEADFESLVRQHSVDKMTAGQGGFLGAVHRGSVRPEVESRLFAAQAGDAIGPFKLPAGWELIKVLEVRPATLNQETRRSIREKLFREWLEKHTPEVRPAW
ncbi:MAG: peptidylprolyl isomerase [Armatimonadetes bacterium]|nr:peptidylprolyl isomerase [Armatimonadota bacterium]